MDENYVKSLENVIKQMLTPLRNIPLQLVIEAISGYKVIPFDPNDRQDELVLQTLSKACTLAGKNVNIRGILRPRPNEVCNDIEKYVREALAVVGYKAYSPHTKRGRTRTMGYPDLELIDEFGRISYLECKTYNPANIGTSQRSFYFVSFRGFQSDDRRASFPCRFRNLRRRQGGRKQYLQVRWLEKHIA